MGVFLNEDCDNPSIMDVLGYFLGAPPLGIFFNVIIALSYLQHTPRGVGLLSWQDIYAFKDQNHPEHIRIVSLLTSSQKFELNNFHKMCIFQ
jgi:hypothetical protein